MGNILQDMMGLLSRKKVVKEVESTDLILLGRTPNPDDSMFVVPKMNNQLITIKDLKAHFDEGEISGGGTVNTIAMFTPDGSTIGDSIVTQNSIIPQLTVNGELRVSTNAYVGLNLTVDGTTTLNGDLQIGNQATDVLLVNSETEFNANVVFDQPGYVEFRGAVADNTSSPGTAGQVLSSTSTGVVWIDASDTLAEVLANGNTTEGNNINFGDGDQAIFGTGNDLSIYHDGSNSYIADAGTGDLIISATNFQLNDAATGERFISAQSNADVKLYFDSNLKLATVTDGVSITGKVKDLTDPTDPQDAATKAYVDLQNAGQVTGTGTTNVLPIWSDGPNSVLSDSLITQTKIDGGTIFDLNANTTGPYTPAINTKLLDLNSGGTQKFSITQDGGGGVILPSGGGVTNPGPSFNMGGGAFSNGKSGVAMGSTTTAFGNGSLAANFLTLASGGGASAFGLLTEAGGLASASFGNKTKASGAYSIASGQDSIASGQSAMAIGEKGDAQGKNTFVSGFGGTATANNAVKFGYEGLASGTNSAKFGFESVASGTNSLATGTGTTASGLQSVASGDNNVVSGNNSFIGGKNSTVTGSESISYGLTNTISANFCTIFGSQNTIPSGGFQSFIAGDQNNAGTLGKQQLIGTGLTGPNSSQGGVYLGRYNDSTDPYSRFQIGNGTTNADRVNALSINYQGRVKLPTYGSGAVTGTAVYNLSVDADGKIIETNTAAGTNYLSAVFLLNQSGPTAPVNVNLLENSLDIPTPFNWTRVGSGEYNLNAPGKFSLLKTIVFINGGSAENNHDVAWEVIDTDNLAIRTHNSDDKLTKASVEIRTYN